MFMLNGRMIVYHASLLDERMILYGVVAVFTRCCLRGLKLGSGVVLRLRDLSIKRAASILGPYINSQPIVPSD
jgi:hypothetical protein